MQAKATQSLPEDKYVVVLVRPETSENIGLVARSMKNTGFRKLRLVGEELGEKSFVTAVHSRDILESAQVYTNLDEATADCRVVFASTSKERKNFTRLGFEEAIAKMNSYPPHTKIGLLFGNERTGLTSEELHHSNFRFTIPQATAQPSYNLAAAVLLSLFRIFTSENNASRICKETNPLSRSDQEECIQRILMILEEKKFIHSGNKTHVQEMIYDLLGRLAITEKDRNLLLAVFSKGAG